MVKRSRAAHWTHAGIDGALCGTYPPSANISARGSASVALDRSSL